MYISNSPRPAVVAASRIAAPTKSEPKAAAECAAGQCDSASVNFDASPLSSKALNLLAATADQAADLKGSLGNHAPGEIILRTKGGLGLASGSVVQDFGATVLGEFDPAPGIHKSASGDFLHIKLPAGISTEEAMAAMAQDERVEFAEPNTIYPAPEPLAAGESSPSVSGSATAPNDPRYGELWGFHNEGQTGGTADADIDLPEAWALETGRDQDHYGPIIAVIDSGVDVNHPDLVGNLWTNPGEIPGDGIDNDNNGVIDDVHGYNAVAQNGDPVDDVGHGTHVAGTIGAQGNNSEGVVGVNHNANIMPIKIGGRSGLPTAAIIRGIQYATKMGARITNSSWGGGRANRGIEAAFAESPALHLMAAGNSTSNNDSRPHYPSSYDMPNNIAVAATDHNDGIARFSSYGATSVDLGAPGVGIVSTVPDGKYDNYSGTSMATPVVAGAAGLLATHFPGISNEELKTRLLGGAEPIPALQGKTVTGARLNVHNSMTMEIGGGDDGGQG